MIIKNASIYDESFELKRLDIKTENEKIVEISENIDGDDIFDGTGLTVLPGFIDIHIHGSNGGDCLDENPDSIDIISKNLARHGVTSFCPTTITSGFETLKKAFENIRDYKGKEQGAYLHGINFEGPYLAMSKKGAQKAEYIRKPDFEEFTALYNIYPVSLADVAPEVEGALEFAQKAKDITVVSMAHTDAAYEEAVKGIENGFSHATHLFNAMSGLSARAPGVIGAVLDSDNVTAELICDGFHINPANLRIAFRLLGEDRTAVVSDAMRSADLPDGEYPMGGQTVYVKNGKALLENGTIAASTSNIHQEFKNLVKFGIPVKQAVKSCTINPAKIISADKTTGSIKVGKFADFVILDGELNINSVIIKGKKYL